MKQPAQNVDDARARVTLILFPGGMSMIKTSTTSRLVLLVVLLPWLQAGSGTGRSKLREFCVEGPARPAMSQMETPRCRRTLPRLCRSYYRGT